MTGVIDGDGTCGECDDSALAEVVMMLVKRSR